MPKLSAAAVTATFTKLMSDLLAERQACAARFAEIDGLFGRYGIALGGVEAKPAAPTAAPKVSTPKRAAQAPVKRKLHRNSKAYEAKLAALAKGREMRWAKHRAAKAAAAAAAPQTKPAGKQPKRGTDGQTAGQFILGLLAGGKSMATAEIEQAWKDQGRHGRANKALGRLVEAKKLARTDNQGGRGSVYSLA